MSKRLATKINTFVKVERTGEKVDRTGNDFVARSLDFLHIHEQELI